MMGISDFKFKPLRIQMLALCFLGVLLPVLHAAAPRQSINGVFALTWLQGFCLNEQSSGRQPCDPDQLALWDHQSFTIHGLWMDPQSTPSKFGKYNRSLVFGDAVLLEKMREFFPPAVKVSSLLNDPEFLWNHEWSKHGGDFAGAVDRMWSGLGFKDYLERNRELQLLFFRHTIQFYEWLGARRIQRAIISKRELATALGVKEEQFNVVCTGREKVREVRVCLEVAPEGINLKDCPKLTSNCRERLLVLPGWESRNQSRVTASPGVYSAP